MRLHNDESSHIIGRYHPLERVNGQKPVRAKAVEKEQKMIWEEVGTCGTESSYSGVLKGSAMYLCTGPPSTHVAMHTWLPQKINVHSNALIMSLCCVNAAASRLIILYVPKHFSSDRIELARVMSSGYSLLWDGERR
jgi:hypothetical protein